MKLNYLKSLDIIVIIIFQIIVLSMYYIGPISYIGVEKTYKVGAFVLIYLFFLILGYSLGARVFVKGITGPKDKNNFLKKSFLITFVFLIFDFIYKIDILNFRFNDIGALYSRSANLVSNSDSLYEYFKMFFGYYIFGLFPLFILSYNKIGNKMKICGFFLIFSTILLYVFSGTNKILFNYLIIFFIIYLMSFKNNIKNYSYIFLIIGVFIAVFFFFSIGQITREGSSAIGGYNPIIGSYSKYSIEDGVLLVGFSSLVSYMIQGYRAFELSFYVDWEWTYGFGNSSFLSRQLDRVLGVNISDLSMPAKIEVFGWDRFNNWSSFYTWWISDVGYYGVCILMLVMGFLFRVVKNTLHIYNDVSSQIIYFYFIILFFYLSANNQIFQSGENLLGFTLLLVPYFLFRKIYVSNGKIQ